jgi:hypothetical protein
MSGNKNPAAKVSNSIYIEKFFHPVFFGTAGKRLLSGYKTRRGINPAECRTDSPRFARQRSGRPSYMPPPYMYISARFVNGSRLLSGNTSLR